MQNKQIVFTAVNTAELQDIPYPKPGPNDAVVRLMVSSISSGTERALVSGELNVSIYHHNEQAHFPRYSGYSSAGVIEEVGENVTQLKPGDHVALHWSTHSHFLCGPASNMVKLDDSISFSDAALLHIGTFPMAALRKCHLEVGESGMVMGLGILGMLGVMFLRAAGATPVIAVDPVASKRERALKFGADYALDPTAPDFAQTVRELTDGGVNVAIEVTGLGRGLDNALDCMKPFGRIALLGCTRHSDFSIDYYHKVHGPGITLVGAHTMARPQSESSPGLWTTMDDMKAQLRLLKLGRINFDSFVQEVHSPEDAPQVYSRLVSEGSAFPIVQFDWSELK